MMLRKNNEFQSTVENCQDLWVGHGVEEQDKKGTVQDPMGIRMQQTSWDKEIWDLSSVNDLNRDKEHNETILSGLKTAVLYK